MRFLSFVTTSSINDRKFSMRISTGEVFEAFEEPYVVNNIQGGQN